jgi:hypothetical protein
MVDKGVHMMLIYKADDGSNCELEEMGSGRLRVRFHDRISGQVAETFTTVGEVPNLYKIMVACRHMSEDFRAGTPKQPHKNNLIDH